MNYNDLLKEAQQNSTKQSILLKHRNAGNKNRGPNPSAIAAFKARKEREELEKILKAKQDKNRLMALRAENSKSLKKAHMMKSRTKDNDFSKLINVDSCDTFQTDPDRDIQETKERVKTKFDLESQMHGLSRTQKNKFLNVINKNNAERIILEPKGPKIQDIIKQSSSKNGYSSSPRPSKINPPSYNELLNLAAEKSHMKVSLEDEIKAEIEFHQKNRKQQTSKLENAKNLHEDKKNVKSTLNNTSVLRKTETKQQNSNRKSRESGQSNDLCHQKNKSIKAINKPTSQSTEKSHRLEFSKSSDVKLRPFDSKPTNAKGKNLAKDNEKYSNIKRKPNHNVRQSELSKSVISFPNSKQKKLVPFVQEPKPKPKLPPIGATYRRDLYRDANDYDEDNYSDEEYEDEDEMADFIDDGPIQSEPEEEYSKHIREIFGYDKRKYKNLIEDDVEVASYGQVMKEERHSLKQGIKEDLEDIQREEEERKRKLLRKKAKMNRSK
ncbi:hypothetical protein NH340_JMT02376 [Sarcoptes scabiei]|uniref:Protein SPT2 homolog n=1 Tax=Sarcoptes scabiei TaxID=52283 RepID=A0A132A2E8_SARSC|nr:hypothetical protein QR98_0036570 [Sarcoptes scabiei]UXI16433.1 hypothetical protein NH340_JMT02376 [Sarcoptes scabiei]